MSLDRVGPDVVASGVDRKGTFPGHHQVQSDELVSNHGLANVNGIVGWEWAEDRGCITVQA